MLAFVGAVAAGAAYFWHRPTVASGDVLAQQLVEANSKTVKAMKCDRRIPITAAGATFSCLARFKDGETTEVHFQMDREGTIHQAGPTPHQKVKRSSDPWGD